MPRLSQNWSVQFSPRVTSCCIMDSSTGPAPITSSNHPKNLGFTSTELPNERWRHWASQRASPSLSTEPLPAGEFDIRALLSTYEAGYLTCAVGSSSDTFALDRHGQRWVRSATMHDRGRIERPRHLVGCHMSATHCQRPSAWRRYTSSVIPFVTTGAAPVARRVKT
jgi:hypothetical protein